IPGTAAAVGVGPFEMTPRSVIGVNELAPASNPGSGVPSANVVIELFAGVVTELFVRRSSLWKHRTPTALPASDAWISAQFRAAIPAVAHSISDTRMPTRVIVLTCIASYLLEIDSNLRVLIELRPCTGPARCHWE